MIQVEVSATEIPIEPGGTAQLTVTVTNRQEHDDHLFFEIEGIDLEWYALPVSSFNITAGGEQCARVLFKVGRASESRAGSYPFVIRARSMETGEAGIAQATLTVKPFSSLQIDIDPKRATSTSFNRSNIFEVQVANLGNYEETLDLHASDPEEACTYEFENARVTVKPGHTETVLMRSEPNTRPFLGSSRLIGFTVTARSATDSYISSNVSGQLERRPVFSFLSASFLVLCLVGLCAFFLLRPKPVEVHFFSVDNQNIVAGQEATLSWNISNLGEGSYIQPINLPVTKGYDMVKVRPEKNTLYKLIAKGGGKQVEKLVQVNVSPKPKEPPPVVVSFSASPTKVHQGDPVTLSWEVRNAVEGVLNPSGISRDLQLWRSQEVIPNQTTIYKLSIKNKDNVVVTKEVKVEVVPITTCIAEIKYFSAKPTTVTSGHEAALAWSVENAASISIDGKTVKPADKITVKPTVTMAYTLYVQDSKGNTVQQTVTVNVREAPPPDTKPDDDKEKKKSDEDKTNLPETKTPPK